MQSFVRFLPSQLSMQGHILKTTQTCFFHLRRLRQVRRLLGRDVTANLVCAFVLSRLDYGNALLAGLPYSTIAPLQRVINAAVRLVYGLRSRDQVTAGGHRTALVTNRSPYSVQTMFVSSLSHK